MSCTDLLWRLAVALLTAFFLFTESLSADVRTLAARPFQDDIVLDGFLNEPAWDQIPAATGFSQREPAAGVPSTEPTEHRVAPSAEPLPAHRVELGPQPGRAPGGAFTTNLFRDRLQAILWMRPV